jgi:1-acyl-sn-glycerol-3-phosphate acyltransferase
VESKESFRPEKSDKSGASAVPSARHWQDTYWLLEGVSLLVLNLIGGLFVQGEENIPESGPVLMVSNHVSYLDPVAIGDASTRRVVFMAKYELFNNPLLNFLLRGVDSFPVKRGEPDRAAFKNTLAMLEEGRVVCIFPEGTRSESGELMEAEPGAVIFAMKTGCPVVPVYVSGSKRVLDLDGKLRRGKITVAFGEPFHLPRNFNRENGGERLMTAIAETHDRFRDQPSRRIRPHWIRKLPEGSRR